jgi:hypothetical protein
MDLVSTLFPVAPMHPLVTTMQMLRKTMVLANNSTHAAYAVAMASLPVLVIAQEMSSMRAVYVVATVSLQGLAIARATCLTSAACVEAMALRRVNVIAPETWWMPAVSVEAQV